MRGDEVGGMEPPAEWVRKYVGLPARECGRGPSHYDCYGLVRHAYDIELGIALEELAGVGEGFADAAQARIEQEKGEWLEVEPGAERSLDLVLCYKTFRNPSGGYILRPLHLGLVAGGGQMLHAEGRIGACLEDYRENPIWEKRIAGFFRHRTLATGEEKGPANPFVRHRIIASEGSTVSQILAGLELSAGELEFVHVALASGEAMRGEEWERPLAAGTQLTISVVPRGAGGMRIGLQVGIVALAITAAVVAGPFAALAVTMLGTLAMAMFLPVSQNKPSKVSPPSPAYSLSGARNSLRPGSPVPVLFGKFRCVPPMAGWYTTNIANKRYFYGIYEVSGGLITDPVLRIGDTHISKFSGVEITFDRGWHPTQMVQRGSWNPRQGWPAAAQFGWTWTASNAGTVPGTSRTLAPNDTITFNDLYPRTDVRAWDINQNKPRADWPNTIQEENIGAALPYGTTGVTRSSKTGADELWINIGLDQLGRITGQGKFDDFTVRFQILEAPAESPNAKRNIGEVKVSGKTQDAVFTGKRWRTLGNSPSGQYNVTVLRLTPTSSGGDSQYLSDATWLNLKTITHSDPVPVKGYARLFVEIKSSGQLTGVLDKLSVEAQRIGPVWEGGAWRWRPTSSPAAAYRLLLQAPSWSDRLPDSSIALSTIANWHNFCTANSCVFNAYVDFATTRDKLLSDICLTGFAAWTMELGTGKMSVAIDPVDQPNPIPVRYFSPANSWNISWAYNSDPIPDFIRITFADATQGYAVKTFEVYADGKNQLNAVTSREQQYLGVTDKAQAHLQARMELANASVRRMVHTRNVGPEYLACAVGDVVGLADDSLAIGLGQSGRIQELIFAAGEGTDEIVGCVLDQRVVMEGGQGYALAISGENAVVARLVTDPVEDGTAIVFFAEGLPLFNGISEDDTWTFGTAERTVAPVIVRDIRPDSRDGSAEITFVSLPPQLATVLADIPEYQSFATLPRALPAPIVDSIISDASVMQSTVRGDLIARVVFRLRPIDFTGYSVTVMYRPSNTDHEWSVAQASALTPGQIAISGVSEGTTYDFILFYESNEWFTSPATSVQGHKVVGRTAPPAPLANVQLSVLASNVVKARWDEIKEVDVRVGGGIFVRHAAVSAGATWAASISLLAQPLAGTVTQTDLPYLPGTYLFRVQDSSGLWSDISEALILDHSVATYANVSTIRDNPTFAGTKQNLEVAAGLRIISNGFNSVPNVNAIPVFNDAGTTVQGMGIYSFAATIDLTAIRHVRVRRHMIGFNDLINDSFVARTGLLSTWQSWSGVTGAPGDCWVEIRHSSLDPVSNPWSAWTRVEVTELTTRWMQARALVFTTDAAYTFVVSELGLDIAELA